MIEISVINKINFEEKLSTIENLTKILTTESVLVIYFYFLVYGSTTPAILREKLGMKKTTLFRNLNLLKDENLIKQSVDSNVKDKRHQIVYQIKERIQNKTEISITNELQEYSKEVNKEIALENWKNALIKSPNFFTSILSKLFFQCVDSSPILKQKQDDAPLEKDLDMETPYQVLTFSLFDGENNSQELKEIMSLVDKITELKKKTDNKNVQDLKNPIVLSITLINFGKK